MKLLPFTLLMCFVFFLANLSCTVYGEKKILTCPRMPKKISCPSNIDFFAEAEIFEDIQQEIKIFDEQILDKVLLNTLDNSNFLVKKTIAEARKHRLCLKKIYDKAFALCVKNKSVDVPYDQTEKMNNRVKSLFELQKTKISQAIKLNEEARSRIMLKERFRGMKKRFNIFLFPLLSRLIDNFKILDDKLTNFTASPM